MHFFISYLPLTLGANILVTEDGRLQLCDFGVSGFLENEVSKRTTIIGTPHWMAPELVTHLGTENPKIQYGTEIDCWAYGCAVFEMATGFPPSHRMRLPELRMRREVPQLEGDGYSPGLKDFIAFCLEDDPESRPSAAEIMQHSYVYNTEEVYPTKQIRLLIERFARWEESGNQRESLFNPYGAQGPGEIPDADVKTDEWNFSTSVEFEKRMSMGLDPFGRSKNGSQDIVPWQRAFEEVRVQRGGNAMKGIFNPEEKPYAYGDERRMSDLPLRNIQNGPGAARDRTTLIDLDAVDASFGEGPNLDLANIPTIRARRYLTSYSDEDEEELTDHTNRLSKRATKDWKFPVAAAQHNRRTQDWKFPGVTISEATTESNMADERPFQSPRTVAGDNRRTQDWQFPTTTGYEAMTSRKSTTIRGLSSDPPDDFDVTAPIPRPGLVHAKTMPVNAYGGFSASGASSPDRTSLIDLDSALSIDIPSMSRPATANSMADSAVTDMTSGDPFDLELLPPTTSNNRGSLHIKSKSEPTAAFQMSNKSTAFTATTNEPIPTDSSASHNRSSSMSRGAAGSSPNRRRWHAKSDDVMDPAVQPPWDSFSDPNVEVVLAQEQRGWERKLGHRRRIKNTAGGSTSSAHTAGTSSQGSIRTPGTSIGTSDTQTLRPQIRATGNNHSRARGSFGQVSPSRAFKLDTAALARVKLRAPREANKAVLLPNADRRTMEEELSMMFEEMALQAEAMGGFIGGLEDEWGEGSGVGFSGEP
jgi:serine/threonine protein kinase